MDGSHTHYCSGDDIRAGDRVRCADWTGVVLFVLGTESFAAGYNQADWSYLGHGFMAEYDQTGLVFSEQADADLVLVARAAPGTLGDPNSLLSSDLRRDSWLGT